MSMSAPVQGYVAAELARGGYQNVHDLLTLACAKPAPHGILLWR